MQKQPDSSEKKLSSEPRNQEPSRPSLGSSSIFSQNRKAPLKIKATPGLLNKINNSKKLSAPITSLAAGLNASRTASMGNGG